MRTMILAGSKGVLLIAPDEGPVFTLTQDSHIECDEFRVRLAGGISDTTVKNTDIKWTEQKLEDY